MNVVMTYFGRRGELEKLNDSCASLSEHGVNLEKLYVLGTDEPAAMNNERLSFVKIPSLKDTYPKHDVILNALLTGIRAGAVGGHFLYCPLGVTLRRTIDLNSYPRFCRGPRIKSIAEMVVTGKGSAVITKYWLSMADTRNLLERNGYPGVDYSGKFLAHMEAEDSDDVERLWKQEPRGDFGYDPASLFGNVRARKMEQDCPSWVIFRAMEQ